MLPYFNPFFLPNSITLDNLVVAFLKLLIFIYNDVSMLPCIVFKLKVRTIRITFTFNYGPRSRKKIINCARMQNLPQMHKAKMFNYLYTNKA